MTDKPVLPRELHLSPSWHPVSAMFECPHLGCRFARRYDTDSGHRMGLAKHMLEAHSVRVFFDHKETSLSEYREQVRRVLEPV